MDAHIDNLNDSEIIAIKTVRSKIIWSARNTQCISTLYNQLLTVTSASYGLIKKEDTFHYSYFNYLDTYTSLYNIGVLEKGIRST